MQMGLVKKVKSISKYVALPPQKDGQTVAFLLCQKCGQTQTFDPGSITENLNAIAEKSGFANYETVIEIIGYCKGEHIYPYWVFGRKLSGFTKFLSLWRYRSA